MRASWLVHRQIPAQGPCRRPRHRRARFQLLAAQTSRYRFWGEGVWTNHGTELAHRTTHITTQADV